MFIRRSFIFSSTISILFDLFFLTLTGLGLNSNAFAKPSTAAQPPSARVVTATSARPTPATAAGTRLSNNAKELTEALNITGQSRNLSMGLLMGKRGSLSFGNIRTDYRDKIVLKSTNF